MWSHLPAGELPFTRMSEGELVARHALRGRTAAQTPALPDPVETAEQFSFAPKPIRVKAIPSAPWGSTRRHYVNTEGAAQDLAGLKAAAKLIKAVGRLAAAQAPPASEPPIRVRAVPSTPWGSTQRHYVNTQGPAQRYDETRPAQKTSGPPADESMETPARAGAGTASSTSRIGRDLGLGTRGVLDGLLGLGDLAAGPIRWGMNGIAELLTGNPEYIQPMAETVPDALGLPRPETGAENLAYQVNSALAPLPVTYGAGGLLAGPRAAAVARPTLAAEAGRVLTEAPVAQAVSAAGSGVALGAAQNAGAGPAAQLGAALLGGAVAPKGVREAWAGEPPPRAGTQRAGLAAEEAEGSVGAGARSTTGTPHESTPQAASRAVEDIFGEAFPQYRGRANDAVAHLIREKHGHVPGAFVKEPLGEIDLPWGQPGEKGYGLAHIIERRNADGLDGEVFARDVLPEIIDGGRIEIHPNYPNRAYIVHNEHRAIIRLDWDGQNRKWVLTAFPISP